LAGGEWVKREGLTKQGAGPLTVLDADERPDAVGLKRGLRLPVGGGMSHGSFRYAP
jgi:hypothetical protein